MVVIAWHLVNCLEQETKYLELGCVDDGLIQVKLDERGKFKSKYFNESYEVTNGKFEVLSESTGWGVSLDEQWVVCAKYRTYEPQSKRSFL